MQSSKMEFSARKTPVNFVNGQCVSLSIESDAGASDDLGDVQDLLDSDFIELCRHRRCAAPSLEQVQTVLSVFHGSLAERISEIATSGKR